jgi:dUTP pyrophosphatase
MSEINIPVEICREDVKLPEYANPHDAGLDIRAAEGVEIEPYKTVVIPSGLKVAIPIGYEIQIRPRSGLSLKTNLRIANSPGTIDTSYRDEIGVIATNVGNTFIYINKGDRIAQIVLNEVPTIKWTLVDSVASIGQNRRGGYGHTGIK